MLPWMGLKNQIFVILLIFSVTFMFIYKLCWQANCSHKNSALALIHCIEIHVLAIIRVSSGTILFNIQRTITLNRMDLLKYDFLRFFKNLEDSPLQRCIREKRTTTLQGRPATYVHISSSMFILVIPLTGLFYFTIDLLYVILIHDIIDKTSLICWVILDAMSGNTALLRVFFLLLYQVIFSHRRRKYFASSKSEVTCGRYFIILRVFFKIPSDWHFSCMST
jgi:hypothetical protein